MPPTPRHVAPLSTLPIAQALDQIWETVPELDRPDDQADPLVPILEQLWDEAVASRAVTP